MKKSIALLMVLFLVISLISCDKKDDNVPVNNSVDTENQNIVLTEKNFFDYFAVQFEYEDLRLEEVSHDTHHKYYISVCELTVRVDNITDKTPNRVSITLEISQKYRSDYEGNDIVKTITIPANGSYSFKQLIETKETQSLTNYSGKIIFPVQPNMSDFWCEVSNVTGTMS